MHIEMDAIYAGTLVYIYMDVGQGKREFSLQMNKPTEGELNIPG